MEPFSPLHSIGREKPTLELFGIFFLFLPCAHVGVLRESGLRSSPRVNVTFAAGLIFCELKARFGSFEIVADQLEVRSRSYDIGSIIRLTGF